MDIAERLQELAECGAYGELCAEARAYLALDAEKQDEDTAYMVRVRLGETLLALSAESFDAEAYAEGVRLLMTAYNERGNTGLFEMLSSVVYQPNETALRENYAENCRAFALLRPDAALPDYDHLPVLCFPISNTNAVLFTKEHRRFLMGEREDGWQMLYHALLFSHGDADELARAADRFSRAVRDARVQECAAQLMDAVQRNDFDAEMQRCAEEYHRLCPEGEEYELFRAEEALARKDTDAAIAYGEAAYEKRKMSARACDFLSRAYQKAGRTDRAMFFAVLSSRPCEIAPPEDPTERERCEQMLRIVCTQFQLAPLVTAVSLQDGCMRTRLWIDTGAELPRFSDTLPCYRVGLYNPYGSMFIKSEVIDLMNPAMEKYNFLIVNDFIFDIMKADETSEICVVPQESPEILPLAAKEDKQKISFHRENMARTMQLSRGEFNFYRVEEPTTIRSNSPFLVGEPIVLQHSPRRRKLVLNILADGLAWNALRDEAEELMPNLLHFFSKGIIFDNNFSASEYTYPSLASIETGLYQHHTQIARPGVPFALDPSVVTLSEQMKHLGYCCTNIQGDGEGIYNGATRGYDRLIVNHWMERTADGVERTIRHLQTFDECDNFLFMHSADTHPYNADISMSAYASVHLPLDEVLLPQTSVASVFLKKNILTQCINRHEVQGADRQLGYLFDYITAHYDDDEYVVLLYSDHGAPVYARSPYLLSEEQTGAALMVRGAGVPARGCVDELTSTVDIYKILGKLAGYPIDAPYLDGNLPEVLGGQRRAYTVSNSIYPGQTYKICVRTEQHAFHLETTEFTREDGTVSLDSYTYHIHERNDDYREIFDDALARQFLDIVWDYTKSFRR